MQHARLRMRRGLALGSTLGLAVAVGTGAATSAVAAGRSASWVPTATRATAVPGAHLVGTAKPATSLRVAVTLRPRHRAAELAALKAMYRPGSATFRHFLTPAEWEARYAPTPAQVSAVTRYLARHGFRGFSVQGDRLLLTATGTVAGAEAAFHTTLGEYALPSGTFRANIGPADVPAALGGTVQAVVGLSNWRLPTPHPVLPHKPQAGSPVIGNEVPPYKFRNTYDAKGTPTGARTRIALFTEGSVAGPLKDLRLAERTYHLPRVPVTVIKVGPQSRDTSGADEWDLDTQTSTEMATSVKHLYLYKVGSLDDTNLDTAIAAFVSQDKAVAMSASVGGCDILPFLDGSMVSTDNVLTEGAMQGQTLFASSGDNGAGCEFVVSTGVPSSFPGTNWPASGMFTTAVGGTTLISDANANRVEEVGWVGSGGGDSEVEDAGFWTSDSDPFYDQGFAQGGRAVPDIAMNGDPNGTAAEIFVNGKETGVGGTSLSSPLALGSWARLQSAHRNRLGMAAIDFYKLYDKVDPALGDTAAVPGFTDIVGGNNGLYTATPGYDEVTGIGVLNLARLDKAIGKA